MVLVTNLEKFTYPSFFRMKNINLLLHILNRMKKKKKKESANERN